uniref:AlNc14C119G6630 protein n=1 Tax=Albugo laibachii Nc14 TaxID=890382 RepID=F0WJA1_9STRA|nr:AlNc14C119G6630 [Albugo laibachii Nc14]|eukprot:CCA21348.1 AlNc14C119G6630 [Albugo laibachii Nc14]
MILLKFRIKFSVDAASLNGERPSVAEQHKARRWINFLPFYLYNFLEIPTNFGGVFLRARGGNAFIGEVIYAYSGILRKGVMVKATGYECMVDCRSNVQRLCKGVAGALLQRACRSKLGTESPSDPFKI